MGQLVWQADYQPFGEASIVVEGVKSNFRFPGQYFDSETGLHYNYFRDYHPGVGRYLQSDPIGLLGGINLFIYAEDDPLRLIDTLGLQGVVVAPVGPLPMIYHPVLAPGTPENDAFVESTKRLFRPDHLIVAVALLSITNLASWTTRESPVPDCTIFHARRRGRDPEIREIHPWEDLGPLKGAPSLPYPGANIGSPDPNLPPPPKPDPKPKTLWQKIKFFVKEAVIRLPWILRPPH